MYDLSFEFELESEDDDEVGDLNRLLGFEERWRWEICYLRK